MIVLLGATGWIGQRFSSYFQKHGLSFESVFREKLDLSSSKNLRAFLKEKRPDFLVNAAGFTGKPNVDACESAKADTFEGNTLLPVRIGEICGELGIPWGHISSGCVYRGHRGVDERENILGFREEDEPNFSFSSGECSFYSGTKALAEKILIRHFPHAYIWRLRIPFDHLDSSRNYLSKLLRYKRLLDARNSLSHLDDFVASAWTTVERQLPFGIYNLTNPGSVTTRDVVDMIHEEGVSRLSQKDLRTAESFLKDFDFFASEEEFMKSGVVALRSNCVLDTTKAESYKLPLRPIREALTDALKRWEWKRKT
ncbi:sugar nucleotide-binding protein [Methylacidiphilales bacterium]|nr:sugar nucleotide-binding protein [Candidatus Methylacidiphilales bacterium]